MRSVEEKTQATQRRSGEDTYGINAQRKAWKVRMRFDTEDRIKVKSGIHRLHTG